MQNRIFALVAATLFALMPMSAAPAQATETEIDELYDSSTAISTIETGKLHEPSAPLPVTIREVVNVSSWYGANYNQKYFACSAGSNGIQCGHQISFTATRSIGLALGADWYTTAAQLSFSASSSQTVYGSCTKTLKAGQKLVAYPYGMWKRYQIKKTTSRVGSTTSGYLMAFNPMGIHCVVE